MAPVKNTRAGSSHKSPARNIMDRDRRTAVAAPTRRGRRLRLQCPFHAKDPDKDRGNNSSCQITGFETPARVVEHLKRVHGPVKTSEGTTDSEGSDPPSPVQDPADYEIERVTQEQLDGIGKLQRNSDPQGKWNDIYNILFPSDQFIKPAYMLSVERLRDHARNPPDWLVREMSRAVGVSQQEIFIMLQKHFMKFFDIVCGNHCSLQPSMFALPPAQQIAFPLETSSTMDMDLLFGAAAGPMCPSDTELGSVDFQVMIDEMNISGAMLNAVPAFRAENMNNLDLVGVQM
ncbi:hypothetical protein E8E14_010558 [Neopestalotiopsis sp. 37M]|nr:hypothetical protein E8E14_010558 [Neopestalotiopsis sp. 37M]